MRLLHYTGILALYVIQDIGSASKSLVMLEQTYPEVMLLYDLVTADQARRVAFKNDHIRVMRLPEDMKIPTFWQARRYRGNTYPRVERYPGVFKAEVVNYPPDTLSKDLQKIYRLKLRYERLHKDLNAEH